MTTFGQSSTSITDCFGKSKALLSLFHFLYPFPKQQILDSLKLKEFADEDFRYDENGTRSTKGVANTVGKGEIARYEQFLLFPQCFEKTCTAET